MQTDTVRRDYLIDQAVRKGKFPATRAGFYREAYDRDPAGTEQALAMLTPALAGVAGLDPADAPYQRALFPELDRQARRAAPVTALAAGAEQVRPTAPAPPAAQPELTPEQVAAWSHALGFDKTAASGRVIRANDG